MPRAKRSSTRAASAAEPGYGKRGRQPRAHQQPLTSSGGIEQAPGQSPGDGNIVDVVGVAARAADMAVDRILNRLMEVGVLKDDSDPQPVVDSQPEMEVAAEHAVNALVYGQKPPQPTGDVDIPPPLT